MEMEMQMDTKMEMKMQMQIEMQMEMKTKPKTRTERENESFEFPSLSNFKTFSSRNGAQKFDDADDDGNQMNPKVLNPSKFKIQNKSLLFFSLSSLKKIKKAR